MNKKTTLLCAVMYAGMTLCAQDAERDLYQAEETCNFDLYKQVLQRSKFEQIRMNDSLLNVTRKCASSGKLAAFIAYNLSKGGQVNGKNRFNDPDTPLLKLTRNIVHESDDIRDSIKLLLHNGDQSLDRALVLAVRHNVNIVAIKMLLDAGANPFRTVEWIEKRTTAINEAEVSLERIKQQKESSINMHNTYCVQAHRQGEQENAMYLGFSVEEWCLGCKHTPECLATLWDKRIHEVETVCKLMKSLVETAQAKD